MVHCNASQATITNLISSILSFPFQGNDQSHSIIATSQDTQTHIANRWSIPMLDGFQIQNLKGQMTIETHRPNNQKDATNTPLKGCLTQELLESTKG